ncbi:hypothetical protein C8R43DRAFT_1130899 [Mycena crocata]|nr:hypothetical protein C8R43DRAFT_1130899 [Mycena crocata]
MTPKTPPPFKKRTIQTHTLDSPISTSPRKIHNVAGTILPKGNKLIVRGAYAADATTHDPIRLIQASVDRLKKEPLLESIPVNIIPFSDRFPSAATAYITLDSTLASMDPEAEPRCDLLEIWKEKLHDANPTWEVAWAPASEGTDKRMWVRFPTLVPELAKKLDREPTKDETVKCLQEILKANNIGVENVFAMGPQGKPPTGAAAVLIHPRQVDTLHRHRSINSHSILPDPIQADRVKQIEIINPFELAIAGISGYEQLEALVNSYLLDFEDEDGQQLAATRNPPGYRDVFVFHMSSWKATKRVLNDHKRFRESFSQYNLSPPELLITFNDGRVAWKATAVSDGAEKIGAKLDTLTRRFDKVERDVGVRLDATHAAITDLKTSSVVMTEQIAHLANVTQNTNLTLISMQKEIALTRSRAPLDAAEKRAKIDSEIAALHGSNLRISLPPPPTQMPLTPPGIPVNPLRSRASPPAASTPHTQEPEVFHSPPETPTALDPDHVARSNKSNKRPRLSAEPDGDITESTSQPSADEKEVASIALEHQDAIMEGPSS